MSTSADKIANLNQPLSELASKLAELGQRRRDHSLDASQGNKTALQAIAALDMQSEQLQRDRRTLSAALEQTEALAKDEQGRLLDKQEQARLREARESAAAVATYNEEIDKLLGVQLREALERRAETLNQLARLHVIDMGYLTRMGKDAVTAAMAHPGLHRFCNLHTPAPGSIRPLAEANNLLGGIGGDVEPTKIERARLHGDDDAA